MSDAAPVCTSITMGAASRHIIIRCTESQDGGEQINQDRNRVEWLDFTKLTGTGSFLSASACKAWISARVNDVICMRRSSKESSSGSRVNNVACNNVTAPGAKLTQVSVARSL